MKAQKIIEGMSDHLLSYSSPSPTNFEDGDRRQQEMQRRFRILESRRSYFERELEGLKNCLFTLDQQIQSYSEYTQLSMQRSKPRKDR